MIAIVSDSHVPRRAEKIPEEIIAEIEKSEKTVHCGDFTAEEVFDDLEEKTDLVAVKGNMDRFELPNSRVFEHRGVKFGVYHGTGIHPRGDHETLLDIAKNKLEVDVLLHGHTHQQEAVKKNGVVLLNPGSSTGVAGGTYRGGKPRMIMLHVKDGIEVEKKILGEELETVETENFSI